MSLSLNKIVNVVVSVSPVSAARNAFDQALIIGNSKIIPALERLRFYSDTNSMLEDGFTNASPEFMAAQIYFSQNPAPTKLWVGRQYTVAPIIVNSATTIDSAIVTPVSMVGVEIGQVVTGTGIPTLATVISKTTTTATLSAPATATGAAVSLTFSRVIETMLEAVQACRSANSQWYIAFVCGAAKMDHLAIAAYIEAATPASAYFGTTADSDVPTATAGNILLTLKSLLYDRTFVQYSTTTPYAMCAAMGYAMGQNTGLNGSAYTLKFKTEVGATTESLTSTQVLNIENANGNLYLNYSDLYNLFEQGVSSSGRFFDEILGIDMLSNNVQLNVMDVLYQNPKVPQTDAGVLQLIRACNSACETALNIGFIAPGVWTGVAVLNLATDQTLPKGYLVQAPAVSTQTQADREARKSPPLYIAIKLAGAIHSVVIGVYVNR